MTCTNKGQAITVLETIAETMPHGSTQREALKAVREWIDKEADDRNAVVSDETRQELREIFEEGARKDKLKEEECRRCRVQNCSAMAFPVARDHAPEKSGKSVI